MKFFKKKSKYFNRLFLQAGDIVSVYADIRNKCLRGSTQPFKSDRVFVGNGRAIQSRDQIFKSSVAKGVAIEMIDSLFDCPSFNHLVQRGIGMLQNLPSVLASHVLDPSPGDCVLDACAAPGGKSTHLATLVGPKGLVFALDKSQNKIEQIIANCLRLGLGNVRCFVQDASTCLLDEKNDLKTTQKPPFPLETFDKILLDAPCSGLGQRPQFINNIGNKELASFPKLQKKIFSTMVKLLKPGGTLVYSTCTFSIEENEEIVLWAISSFQELTLIDSEPRIGQSGIQIEGMTETMAKKVQRFFVSPRDENIKNCDNDTIGFFIAKFCKR